MRLWTLWKPTESCAAEGASVLVHYLCMDVREEEQRKCGRNYEGRKKA